MSVRLTEAEGKRLLALRADMDALPVEEKNDLPFKSRIPGQMHACGHDAHTAILLAVAGYLKAHEEELPCRVRLIFQPSEEGAVSGARMMVEEMPSRMSSEDFFWYLTKAPGMIFRFGIRNEEKGCTAIAHRNDFCIDEDGMKSAIGAFIAYVMQERSIPVWKQEMF